MAKQASGTRGLRLRIRYEIDALEALYYLGQATGDPNRQTISLFREAVNELPSNELPQLHKFTRTDLDYLKSESGCTLSEAQLRKLYRELTTTDDDAWLYVPKFVIEYWFTNYKRIFPRWPHIPLHAMVMFDTDPTRDSPYALWLAEAELFRDADTLWRRVLAIYAGGKGFRDLTKEELKEVHTYMRATATTAYQSLEAYLNGLAFNCVFDFRSQMSRTERTLLTEWDARTKRPRFVSFSRKLIEYPAICGRFAGHTVSLTGNADAAYLSGEGKALRDGLTHPAPLLSANVDFTKVGRILSISKNQVLRTLEAVRCYVREVERAMGRNPSKSTPWVDSK